MSWPNWIDELTERYLADEASVFLLYGDVADGRWTVGDQSLDCVTVLVRYLERTRQVVGVHRAGSTGLGFGNYTDEARFDRLVKAEELMLGDATQLANSDPLQALGRIWRALGTLGTDQAYIVSDIETVLPSHRKRVDPIPGGAPCLFEWPGHPRLRRSNNIVLILTERPASVRAELVAAAALVHVDRTPVVPIDQLVAETHLAEDVRTPVPASQVLASPQAFVAPAPAAPPPPPDIDAAEVADLFDDDGVPVPEDPLATLRGELRQEVVRALITHPEEHRADRIPVMDAVACVLARRLPETLGALTFQLDDEGAVVVDGPGEEWFHSVWRGDIALDASASMLLKSLPSGFSAQARPHLDDTAVAALAKRVARILAAHS